MSLIDGKELEQAREPTPEELLAEAKAWGFESWDAFCDFVEAQAKEQTKRDRNIRYPWVWSEGRLTIALFYASAESGEWARDGRVMRYGLTWALDKDPSHFGRALGCVIKRHWFGIMVQWNRAR